MKYLPRPARRRRPYSLGQARRRAELVHRLSMALLTGAFAMLGYTFLNHSSAATFTSTKEAEAATLSGAATIASSSGTSGGSSVKFGGAALGWADADIFKDPQSNAAKQAATWNTSNPAGAARMRKMAQGGEMNWIGDWLGGPSNVQSTVSGYMNRVVAAGANKIGLMALYAIPKRDCGGYSGGGYVDAGTYGNYINAVSNGIGTKRAIIILEPDALPQLTTCLSGGEQSQRLQMLSNAISTLKSKNPNVKVYLDAGNSGWIDATTMSGRLNSAGVAKSDGFATNVSNFKTTASEMTYGNSISSKIGGKHYVIDTSRNGKGDNGQWCNPSGRALGVQPTFSTNNTLVDAFLWIKKAGESDGQCNGGPSPGTWWPAYADGLAINAGY